MKLRKAIIFIGGPILIVAILAFRFGLFATLFAKEKSPTVAAEVAPKKVATAKPKVAEEAPAPEEKVTPAPVKEPEVTKSVAPKAEVVAPKAEVTTTPVAPKAEVTTTPVAPKAEVTTTPVATKAVDPLGLGDPFSYSNSSAGDFSPLTSGQQVGAIAIKGIINTKGNEPIAVLEMSDTAKVYFVRKNDVIRINTKAKSGSLITEAYIVVKEIRESEVELVQQERPDKVIIVR